MAMKNGQTYEGEWFNGMPHGTGKEMSEAGEYNGEFLQGKKHGQGKLEKVDVVSYEGTWESGAPHGHGVETYANGPRFEGEYHMG